ncbi:hypothetical protein ACFQ9X_27155 [Catenulispora yoronensis]
MTASERPEPPGVFLAFASEDSPRALSLDASLRASGARTAFDESEEPDEELPSEVVLQDLGACDGFVLVWSRHTAEDDGVSELRRLAASFDKPCFVRSLDATPAPEDVDGRIPAEDDDAAATAAVHRLLGAQPPVSAPRPHLSVEPGRWQITSDAQHGETLDLELTGADGSGPSPASTAGPASKATSPATGGRTPKRDGWTWTWSPHSDSGRSIPSGSSSCSAARITN